MKKIGMIGLGRMGGNMARRLRQGGAEVVAHNRNCAVTRDLAAETGLRAAETLPQLMEELGAAPRIVWLMLPAGEATQQTIDMLLPMLQAGDVLVDGANAFYKDSQRRAGELAAQGIRFVDVGVSGGVWGLKNGYAMMVGGEQNAVEQLEPFLKILAPAPDKGWLHCGPAGSGHFVKMIHNGIEYGMMQAFAEGFGLMKGKAEFDLDLAAIAEMWRHGSVVRSWLLDLSAEFLQQDQSLDAIAPFVADSGEGRWTAFEAIEQGVPAPVMSLALMMRFATQGANDYPARLLAMMRKGFGGHAVKDGEK
ncbi:6-phosphogluconate dehydrogenase [Sulfurimicrobium lacus]|uniref:6-phosphogluconate dehydrogenase n=1 Tax=Sulfurimicrobium lacus TaxID=2715678 RepID=A0A6F8VDA3_9PROT|nr:decarboxylating 6-phosphogluconate dehydrogenase [Sulfurimicrobium lacus]BCB26996.1 6-phosphogluconate dehydrogenase [Sulfurimicrobium lacus]